MFNHFNKFDSFNHFSIKLNKEAVYNPYINYTWEMLPNAKVKNSGTSGVDLQLYSGNPMDFQGSQYSTVDLSQSLNTANDFTITLRASQNVDNKAFFDMVGSNIGLTFTGFYAEPDYPVRLIFGGVVALKFVNSSTYVSLLTTYSIKKVGNMLYGYVNGVLNCSADVTGFTTVINSSMAIGSGHISTGYIIDGQYDMFVVSNYALTDTQITQASQYPNAFYESMKNDANTLFCTDFGGNSGYIADDRNVSVIEKNNKDAYSLQNGTILDSDGFLICDGSGVGYSTVMTQIADVTNGNTYGVKITSKEYSSGALQLFLPYYTGVAMNFNGERTYILKSGTFFNYLFLQNGAVPFVGKIKIETVSELSNIYPITNYSETMRTNFQQEPTGLQDLTRSFDSLGFYVGVTDFLNCNGVGYGDTGWIINPSDSQDFSLELIAFAPLLEDRTTQTTICGKLNSGSGNAFNIKTNIDNRCFVSFGSSTTTFIPTIGQYFHLTVVKLSAPNSYSVFLNGVIDTESPKDSSFWSSDYQTSILLGGAWTSTTTKETSYKSGIRLFKVHNKALTQEEITKNYNDYVAQGLLI